MVALLARGRRLRRNKVVIREGSARDDRCSFRLLEQDEAAADGGYVSRYHSTGTAFATPTSVGYISLYPSSRDAIEI
jgi:hypothetical protein